MAGRYRVILTDPAWLYTISQGDHRWGEGVGGKRIRHYDGLSVERMMALPIADIAAPDCALLMWATMPLLPDALRLMAAWGFTYKTTAFTWVKLNRDGSPFLGMGHYTRANTELCLLGTRGSPRRKARNVPQVILSRRREHSRKPDQQYDRIMSLFDGPYCECFARQQWPGWDTAFSDQSHKFLAQPFLFGEATA